MTRPARNECVKKAESKRTGERKTNEVTVGIWMRLRLQVYHVGLISAARGPSSVYAAVKFAELRAGQ